MSGGQSGKSAAAIRFDEAPHRSDCPPVPLPLLVTPLPGIAAVVSVELLSSVFAKVFVQDLQHDTVTFQQEASW